jgi:sugar transferase EpsL
MFKILKLVLDVLVSFTVLLVLSPLIVIIAVVLWISLGENPLFLQKRPGLHERPFYLIKFKTMQNKKDENGDLLSDELRITKTGNLIRKYSLDELPQLINVLKRDMSLVGPRPLLMDYLPLYSEFQKRRHDVLPGITGWAQINGRNAISWEKKFELDVWYVEHQSFRFDLKILWLTLYKVAKSEGVSAYDHITVDRFTGKN